jgi:hypothetical protein
MILRAKLLPPDQVGKALDEAVQLRAIFARSVGTARANKRKRNDG